MLGAARLNDKDDGQVEAYGYIKCNVVKPGIFAAGAILALLSAVFGIGAYITLTPPPVTTTNPVFALPMVGYVDPEKNPMTYPPQQSPLQQYPPQQYPPRQQY